MTIHPRKVSIVFRIDGYSLPTKTSTLETFQLLPAVMAHPSSTPTPFTVSVGRRLRKNALEYYASIDDGASFVIRHGAIDDLLNALGIPSNVRGKFIIQQSELLTTLRQRNTSLLEIIEECSDSAPLAKAIARTEKKLSALYEQKESVKTRLEEIDVFVENNKEMEALQTRALEEQDRLQSKETEAKRAQVESLALQYLLAEMQLEELAVQRAASENRLQQVVASLQSVSEETKRLAKELQENEKSLLQLDETIQTRQQRVDQQRECRRQAKRTLKQAQERLLTHLDARDAVETQLAAAREKVGKESACDVVNGEGGGTKGDGEGIRGADDTLQRGRERTSAWGGWRVGRAKTTRGDEGVAPENKRCSEEEDES